MKPFLCVYSNSLRCCMSKKKKNTIEVQAFNSSPWEAETRRYQVHDEAGLLSMTLSQENQTIKEHFAHTRQHVKPPLPYLPPWHPPPLPPIVLQKLHDGLCM